MNDASAKSRKLSKAERRRREIVEVAADMFLKAGYDGVSLDAIIDRSGGSKASIYKDFGGKDSLFQDAIQERCELILAPLLSGIPTSEDPRTALRSFCLLFLKSVLSEEALSLHRTIAAEADRFPELAEAFFLAGPHTVYAALEKYFAHLQEQGLFREGDPAQFARLFHGMVLNELQMAQLFCGVAAPGEQKLQAHVDRAIDFLVSGIFKSTNA